MTRSTSKQCSTCRLVKARQEFERRHDRTGGLRGQCKTCRLDRLRLSYPQRKNTTRGLRRQQSHIEWLRKSRYGLSSGAYQQLLTKQNGRCANRGCRSLFGAQNRPCIDHCHSTKRVRGLLCHGCNVALGFARESIQVLRGLISYAKTTVQTSGMSGHNPLHPR